MERIGKIGWFLTDEEYERISNAVIVIQEILDSVKTDSNTITLKPVEDPDFNKLAQPQPDCSKCPWCPGTRPVPCWTPPADWRWRPEQAPWYGDPIDYKRYEVGDGEWWKHQPYCTSTTEDNPNTVKETKTTGDGHVDPEFINKLRNFAKTDPNPTRE